MAKKSRKTTLTDSHGRSLARCWILIIGLVSLHGTTTLAEEPADAFLSALKQRGYFDLAIEYVERMQTSPLAKTEWQQASDYHLGILRIEQAAVSRDVDQAKAHLAVGISHLQAFCQSHPDHPHVSSAENWLAKSLVQSARVELSQYEKASAGVARERQQQTTKRSFEAAQAAFSSRIEELENELKEAQSEAAPNVRDRLRTDLIGARLEVAMIDFELAQLDRDDPASYAKQLEKAQAGFAQLEKDYNKRLVGFEARYFQGRCLEELGKRKEALTYYLPFFDESDLPLSVMAKPVTRALVCWVHPSIGEVDKAVQNGQAWIERFKPAKDSVEAAPVRLALAKAYRIRASEASPSEARKSERVMRALLLAASSVVGSHQAEARTLLAQTRPAATETVDPKQWRTFDDARQAGDELHQQFLATDALIELQRRNLETLEDPRNRQEVEAQLTATLESQDSLRLQALAAFRRALALASPEVDTTELRQTQYLAAFLMYHADQPYDAAVISAFVATNDPGSAVARECAKVAMASYWKLYQLAQDDAEREASTRRIVHLADFVAKTWPSDPSAQDALANLVSFMVNEGNTDRAIEYLQQIPEASPQRASAELRVGQAIWRKYVAELDQLAQQNARGQLMAIPPKLDKLRKHAREVLTAGLVRAEQLEPDQNIVQAALTMAQTDIESGTEEAAERRLRHPKYGPLTLIENGSPIVEVPGLKEQAYKTMVRAKIASLPSAGEESDQVLGEALSALDAMQHALGDSAESRRRLTATYLSLARDLKRQLEVAAPSARPAIAKAFENFVMRVTEETSDPNILNWAGETLISLAEATDVERARGYYSRATEAFQRLLERSNASQPIDPALARQAKLRMATAKRKLNRHQEAVNLLDEVLREKNQLLNVQAEAALTYQEAGEFGALKLFDLAIKGGRKNNATGKNNIWGWEGIASRTAAQMKQGPEQRAKFADAFFEARYNIAFCRYRQSVRATEPTEKANYLKQARRSLSFTTRLYPDLGARHGNDGSNN